MANATGKLIYSDALIFLRRSRKRSFIMKRAVGRALKFAIGLWRKGPLKNKFEASAPFRYPGQYQKRSAKYIKRKQKKFGHNKPMVFSGEFRAAMLAAAPQMPSKITKRIRVKFLPTPRVINLHARGSFHDFPKALTAFNRRDKREFAEGIERSLKKLIKRELKRRGAKTVKRFTA